MKRLFSLFILLICSGATQATYISGMSVDGDILSYTDDGTVYEWLQWDVTTSYSISDVLDMIDSDGVLRIGTV